MKKPRDVKKRDVVVRDGIAGLDLPTKKRLLAKRNELHRAVDPVGKVRRIEGNGQFAWVGWFGGPAKREPIRLLTAVRRKGKPGAKARS